MSYVECNECKKEVTVIKDLNKKFFIFFCPTCDVSEKITFKQIDECFTNGKLRKETLKDNDPEAMGEW